MGCAGSLLRPSSHDRDIDNRSIDKQSQSSDSRPPRQSSIQDEARSFRSKTGAIKLLCRNPDSFQSFLAFLKEKNRQDFLICYCDIEEIKLLDEDQVISRTAALLWRYKSMCEAAKLRMSYSGNNNSSKNNHGGNGNNSGRAASSVSTFSDGRSSGASLPVAMELSLWECFGKLRHLHITDCPAEFVIKHLVITQNELLARLVLPFEAYLHSTHYKDWKQQSLQREKARRLEREREREKAAADRQSISQSSQATTSVFTPFTFSGTTSALVAPQSSSHTLPTHSSALQSISVNSMASLSLSPGMMTLSATAMMIPHSLRSAVNASHILVVDDSTVTLKLTGLTLERDGHCVERAINGQVALNMMKSRPYDVVLIDCNMPVMDGFEAVRLFRETERARERESESGNAHGNGERESGSERESDEDDDLSSLSGEDELLGERDREKDRRGRAEKEREKAETRRRRAREREKRREERRRAKERIDEGEEEDRERDRDREKEKNEKSEKETEREREKHALPLASERDDHHSIAKMSLSLSPRAALLPISPRSEFLSHKLSQMSSAGQSETTTFNVNPTTGKFASFCESENVKKASPVAQRIVEDAEKSSTLRSTDTLESRTHLSREYYRQLIIGMSTNIDEETRSKALAAGMDAFLPKPFTLEKFIETIRLTHTTVPSSPPQTHSLKRSSKAASQKTAVVVPLVS